MVGSAARPLFPALASSPVTYLDSATTTPLAGPVITAVTEHLGRSPASAGRGGHPAAMRASTDLARARRAVATFIGAEPEQVFFTAGASHSHALMAQLWGPAVIRSGDEILYSRTDHASALRPWLRLARQQGATAASYRIGRDGGPETQDLLARIGPRTRLVCLTHVHQIFGARTDVAALTSSSGSGSGSGPLWLVDASQSIGHLPVNVALLGADVLLFSGHKMFALPGIGVLYLSGRALQDMPSDSVSDLEAGTVNLPGAIALAAAADFLQVLNLQKIGNHSAALMDRLAQGLRRQPGVRLMPGPAAVDLSAPAGTSLVSFQVEGLSAQDLDFALSEGGFQVRAGGHCLMPGNPYENSVRVSSHVYTDTDHIDGLLDHLRFLIGGGR